LIRLQRKLDKAVKDERYEEAAKLRDKIVAMQATEPVASEKVARTRRSEEPTEH
jgi:protein-arginine kinase activator protein McsA